MILASNSPRRKEICELLGLKFTVIPAESEIEIDTTLEPMEAVKLVALSKAENVFLKNPQNTVIGSDTAVYCDNEFLGKPKDKNDARRMLKMLSGKRHYVFTGVAVMNKDKTVAFCEKAEVYFQTLSDVEIQWYVNTSEPYDKAGAYAVQGLSARFIEKIDGDFYTVMGLPCHKLYEVLKEF